MVSIELSAKLELLHSGLEVISWSSGVMKKERVDLSIWWMEVLLKSIDSGYAS